MGRRRRLTASQQIIDDIEAQHLDLGDENDALRHALARALDLRTEPRKERKRRPYGRRKRGTFRRGFVIPDTQCKPGVPIDHLRWAGEYVADHAKPGDFLVHIGDHWDFPSLSSYDRGKKCFEGRRYAADVKAGNDAWELFVAPIRRRRTLWSSLDTHFAEGNHEWRQMRLLQTEPYLEGVIGRENLAAWHSGFTWHNFQDPFEIDGILFCHYFYSPMSSRPYGGSASNVLSKVGQSFVQGHRQVFDTATHQLPNGRRRRGVIAGAFYQHDEDYIGPQGAAHWRGILVLNECDGEGDFDLTEVSLDYLRRRYA